MKALAYTFIALLVLCVAAMIYFVFTKDLIPALIAWGFLALVGIIAWLEENERW